MKERKRKKEKEISYYCNKCNRKIELDTKTYFPERCENCKIPFKPGLLYWATFFIALLICVAIVFVLKILMPNSPLLGVLETATLVAMIVIRRLLEICFQKKGWITYTNVSVNQ